jgi:hypothetical protein
MSDLFKWWGIFSSTGWCAFLCQFWSPLFKSCPVSYTSSLSKRKKQTPDHKIALATFLWTLPLFRYRIFRAVRIAAITLEIINDSPNNSELTLRLSICGVPVISGFGIRSDWISLKYLLKSIGLWKVCLIARHSTWSNRHFSTFFRLTSANLGLEKQHSLRNKLSLNATVKVWDSL